MKSLSLSSPHIIATVGLPGVGKTYFAEQFAETFSSPLISSHIFDQIGADKNLINQINLGFLKEVMKTKKTIVFEGATDRRVDRMELAKLARQNGYKVLFVWVQTDPSTAKQRALRQISPEQYDMHVKRFSAPHETESSVVISGRHTYSTQARTILKRLTKARSEAANNPVEPVVPQRQSIGRIHVN